MDSFNSNPYNQPSFDFDVCVAELVQEFIDDQRQKEYVTFLNGLPIGKTYSIQSQATPIRKIFKNKDGSILGEKPHKKALKDDTKLLCDMMKKNIKINTSDSHRRPKKVGKKYQSIEKNDDRSLYKLRKEARKNKFAHTFENIESQGFWDFTVNHKVDPEFTTTVEAFKNDIVSSFNEINNTAVDGVSGIREVLSAESNKIASVVNNTITSVLRVAWIVPICGLVCFVATRPNMSVLAKTFVAVLATVLPVAYKPVLNSILSFCGDSSQIESQAGSFDMKSLRYIITTATMTGMALKNVQSLSNMFDASDCHKADKNFSIMGVMNSIRQGTGNANVYGDFVQWVLSTMEDIINFFRNLVGKDSMNLYTTGERDIDDWATRVSELLRVFAVAEKDVDTDMVHMLTALRNEGAALQDSYRFRKEVSIILESYLRQLDYVCKINAAVFTAARNTRTEPECLGLYGSPGIGKTLLCNEICAQVIARTMPLEKLKEMDFNPASQIFQKGDSEFWNGYAGQCCVVLDDFCQQVDAIGATGSDAMNFIRIVNSWMYPLNFADLENKGKNFFRSKFVMMTTNVDDIGSVVSRVVNDPKAVLRRIHHAYELGVNPDFRKSGYGPFDADCLDSRKIRAYVDEHNSLPLHAWFVKAHDFGHSKKNNPPIKSLSAVIDDIVTGMKHRESNLRNLNKMNVSTVKSIYNTRCAESKSFGEMTIEAQGNDEFQECDNDGSSYWEEYSQMSNRSAVIYNAAAKLKELRSTLKESLFHPAKFLEENPMISFIIGCPVLIALFSLVKLALGSICKTLFGAKEVKTHSAAIEDQMVSLKNLRDVTTKTPMNMDVQDSVAKNIYNITVTDEFRMKKADLGQCVGLVSNSLMMPRHFFTLIKSYLVNDQLSRDAKIRFTNIFNPHLNMEAPVTSVLEWPKYEDDSQDLLIVKAFSNMCAKDITQKFITEADLKALRNFECVLTTSAQRGDAFMFDRRYGQAVRFDNFKVEVGAEYIVKRGMRYNICTEVGDCGGLLMLGPNINWSQGRKIVGIHTGGTPSLNVGYSTVITAEVIQEAVKQLDIVVETVNDPNIVCEAQSAPVEGTFLPLYTVKNGTNLGTKSKLVKTDLYEMWGPNTRFPAHLSHFTNDAGERKKPMLTALAKYSTPVHWYDSDEISMCAYVAFNKITEATKDIMERSILSFEDAVLGREDNAMMRSMPRGTSSGYPFVLIGAKGKKDFFGEGDDFDLDNENCAWLRGRVDEIIENAKKGVRELHVFNDFLKDERRSAKKNNNGETRLVSGAPIPYVIAFRMYFLRFMAALLEKRISCGCTAGINVYSEWGDLKNHLMNMSTGVIAGDYSAFDSSEQPQLHDAILDYVNKWYDDGEENARVRRVLWMDLTNSRHIAGDGKNNNTIYQWHHSLPSGHPATTMANSMYNLLLFTICFKRIMGAERLRDYHSLVRPVVLGDDNMAAIHESIQDRFNQITITEVMKDLHMTYTSETKDECVEPIRDITQVDFLKRGFRDQGDFTFGPISLDTIREMPYWSRNKRELNAVTESNFENAIMELSAHSQEVWDEIFPKMHEAYKLSGRSTALRPERADYQLLFKNAEPRY
jgi:hypothetical protein